MSSRRGSARPTIKDVAESAGVSTGAASYALNGRPGVSAATRERVLAAADALGWLPDNAARRLAGARTETIGLVLPATTADTLGDAPWFMEFISGVESVLVEVGYGLLLQVAAHPDDELAIYRIWTRSRRVDGVILVDLVDDDPRAAAAEDFGFPVVAAGPPGPAAGLTCVWTDDGTAMSQAVRYLATLGHRHLGRISGPERLAHTAIRRQAFEQATAEATVRGTTWVTDFSMEQVRTTVRNILMAPAHPTALLFDDDFGAVLALGVAHEMGLSVPTQLSILAWDDSVMCRSTYPQLSAMSHDVRRYGSHVTRRLLDLLDGTQPATHLDEPPQLVPRGSTGPRQ